MKPNEGIAVATYVTDNNSVMLNTSELLFNQVISDIEDYAIFILDTSGNIQTWNKGAERIKGYSEEEVLNKHFSIFYTEEDKNSGLPGSLLEEAVKTGKTEHEGWRVGKYDDVFWANVVITALTDDNGYNIGFIKVTRDLSERVAAEKVISEYETDLTTQARKTNGLMNMYQNFINEVEGYAIIMLDKDGIILDWNKGAEEIKGYSSKNIIGNHFSVFYTKEDKDALLPDSLLYRARQYGRVEHEGWRVKADGTTFWANVIITALYNDITGALDGYTKVTRDRTEAMKLELERKKYTQELELEIEKVLARDQQLERAYNRLSRSTNVRSRFVRSATEDMQIPVKNISNAAIALTEILNREDSNEANTHLQNILVSNNTIKKGIQDLALLSVVLEDNLQMENSPFDANKMISEILTGSGGELSSKCQIEYKYDGDTRLDLSPMLVKYVVENTILNAVKFSPEQSLIKILSKNDGKNVVIQVEDKGIGIPDEEQQYLFESFFRGSNARHLEGTGLSLFLSKNFIDLMGGNITFESQVDKGSVFTITLPVTSNINKVITQAS